MPPPPCPTLVPLANFSDKKAYLDYLIAFIKYFYYYSQSFIFTLQSHAGGNLKDIEEPYRAAKAQLDADTIVQRLPQLNEAALRNEYINRCIAFSKMKATNNTTAILYTFYCTSAIQLFISELTLRYPNDTNALIHVLNTSKEETLDWLGVLEQYKDANRRASEKETLYKLYEHVGQTIIYKDNQSKRVVKYDILNGTTDVLGEIRFLVNKTIGSKVVQENISHEELAHVVESLKK